MLLVVDLFLDGSISTPAVISEPRFVSYPTYGYLELKL
jgi:hypothetical protein